MRLYFYLQPNPVLSKWFFIGMIILLSIIIISRMIKEIRSFMNSKVSFEIVWVNGKRYVVKYEILKGKRNDLDVKEI